MTRCEFALQRFQEGSNCAQSVVEAFAPDYGVDPALARCMAAFLAGGSGVGGECGVVGGAYLVLGLRYASHEVDGREANLAKFRTVKDYQDGFQEKFGSLNCSDLLGLDIFTPEGYERFHAEGLKAKVCAKVLEFGVAALDRMCSEDRGK